MPKYMFEYFFILKNTWEVWVTANDPNSIFSASLTPDESGYIVNVPSFIPELKQQLESIDGSIRLKTDDLYEMQNNNPTMFTETGDGHSPVTRGVMIHPQEADIGEFTLLYTGPDSLLTFNPSGNSTWDIDYNHLFTANTPLDSVIKADNKILLNFSAFPNNFIPSNDNYYIIMTNFVVLNTYDIISVTDQNGTVRVTLDIPNL